MLLYYVCLIDVDRKWIWKWKSTIWLKTLHFMTHVVGSIDSIICVSPLGLRNSGNFAKTPSFSRHSGWRTPDVLLTLSWFHEAFNRYFYIKPGHKLSEMCSPTHHCQIQMCRLGHHSNADWVCFVGCLSLVHRYLLQPKGNGKSKTDDLGSLRLNVTYIEDNVLPSACYTPLRTLLLKSPDIKVLTSHTWSAWMVHYAH